ncbi:MAG TPA: FAD binding domain-containing protein [Alphaproteobacteria bacterium]|nr:FAD binding domain-containing protein [Alphaproteobacteria bacterium]
MSDVDLAPSASGWVSRSHRAIAPFELVRATSVDEALAALRRRVGAAVALAGGIDLVRTLRAGRPADLVVTLKSAPELARIEETADGVVIGACVTHHRMETDPVVARTLPALAAAWRTIGNIRVRLAGTVGGNVMAREPAYDGPVLLAAVDASLHLRTQRGAMTIKPAETPRWKAPPSAVLETILVPRVERRWLAFDRSLKPVVSVALAIEDHGPAVLLGRAAVGCAYPVPICRPLVLGGATDVGAIAGRAAEIAKDFVASLPPPLDDAFASRAYRRRMIEVQLRRQLAALSGAGHG